MGLLDGIRGKSGFTEVSSNPLTGLLGSLGGGGSGIVAAAMSLLQQHGGLSGVLDLFRSKGLGQQAESWVSDGPNMEVSPQQVEQTFGGDKIDRIASQLHLTRGEASADIANILPEVVDRLTPEGKIPDDENDLITRGLTMLRGGDV